MPRPGPQGLRSCLGRRDRAICSSTTPATSGSDKVGARSWGVGAGVGARLVLLGPAALGVGLVGGTLAGGLHHKGLKLSDEDKARISADLSAGKAAVGVLATDRGWAGDP